MTQHYDTVVDVNTEPVTIRPGATEAEHLAWEAVQARRLANAYLEANLTSFERYQEAKVARSASAMARQAEAMIQFADLALQTSRMATLKWFEVERLFESALEKALAELASKGLSWDEMLVRWHDKLKKEGVSTELRDALITAQVPETEIDRLGERLEALTPERIKEVLATRRERLEAAAAVREQLANMGSEASWPEPPDISGLERLQQMSRRLLQRVLDLEHGEERGE